MNGASTYTIGELSEQTGVSRRTIHFYVQQNTLPPPAGAGLGTRYSVEHRSGLEFVPVLRRCGLRLDESRAQLSGLGPAELEQMLTETPAPPPAPVSPPAPMPHRGATDQEPLPHAGRHRGGGTGRTRSPPPATAGSAVKSSSTDLREENRISQVLPVEKIKLGLIVVADELSSSLALEHTDVVARFVGTLTSVSVTQRFGNPLNEPAEIDYLFPLPHKASLIDFQLRVGERIIQGDLQELEQA